MKLIGIILSFIAMIVICIPIKKKTEVNYKTGLVQSDSSMISQSNGSNCSTNQKAKQSENSEKENKQSTYDKTETLIYQVDPENDWKI